MAYGKVNTTVWTDPGFRALSDEGRLFELYLRTAPHRNRLGLFVLDELYAAADLQWGVSRVKAVLAELQDAHRIMWDGRLRVVFVLDTWEVEALENPNVVKGALRELETVPRTVLLTVLLKAVEANYRDHYLPLVQRLKELSEMLSLVDNTVENSSTNDSGNGLATPTSPDLTSPNPTEPFLTRDEKEAWARLRPVVLKEWHQGEEVIQLSGGGKVGMWAEHQKFIALVRVYGLEETVGAICTGPTVFGVGVPMSLNWFTSGEFGPANFSVACGAYYKSLDT